MFLLRLKCRHWQRARIYTDYEAAKARALEHVGQHNPKDGCSTEVYHSERRDWNKLSLWRNTSFGKREAWIDPISVDEELEISQW